MKRLKGGGEGSTCLEYETRVDCACAQTCGAIRVIIISKYAILQRSDLGLSRHNIAGIPGSAVSMPTQGEYKLQLKVSELAGCHISVKSSILSTNNNQAILYGLILAYAKSWTINTSQ